MNDVPIQKLNTARDIILELLSSSIKSFDLRPLHGDLKIGFYDNKVLYVTYNEYDEYSYQLLFSDNRLDRIRFDNYDKEWSVDSKPNHFHPRLTKFAYQSPMIGDVEHDIRLLCDLIESKVLMKSSYRF